MGAPPCGEIPDHRWRLVHTAGWAFVAGASCGGAFHFCQALLRGSPPGGRRLAAGAQAVRAHAPRVAGSAGAYLALRCAFESAASLARRKDDPWNSVAVAAASATWAMLDARQGARVAARSAVLGAACGALVEGAMIAFNRRYETDPRYLPPPPLQDDPTSTPPTGHAPMPGCFQGIPRQTIVVEEIPIDYPRSSGCLKSAHQYLFM